MPYTQERKEKYSILSVELTKEAHQKLKAKAKQRNMKVSQYVREAIESSYR